MILKYYYSNHYLFNCFVQGGGTIVIKVLNTNVLFLFLLSWL